MSEEGVAPDLEPSAGHAFEPEFLGQPPRAIPEELERGPWARRQRATAATLLAAGVLALVLSPFPGVDVLARYVLPLAYLRWIGAGLVALAGTTYARYALRTGPYRYVTHGMPVAARVLALQKVVTALVNGVPSTYAIQATVALRHPETRELFTTVLPSNPISAGAKDHYDAPFRVGDTVTAVFLPGRFEKSLRLYAYLELSPGLPMRRAAPPESPAKTAAAIGLLVLFFLAAFANVYAYGRYEPVDFDYRRAIVPMAAGGVLLGGGLLAGLYHAYRSDRKKAAARTVQALREGGVVESPAPFLGTGVYRWVIGAMLVAGAPLLGAVTALCWCFMANAWLDASAPRRIPATVVSITQTTHALLFREYEIEFTLEGVSAPKKLLSSPEELGAFDTTAAVALLRDGRFGWPWVERVEPARP